MDLPQPTIISLKFILELNWNKELLNICCILKVQRPTTKPPAFL